MGLMEVDGFQKKAAQANGGWSNGFIRAYHEFRESVDFTKSGIVPDLKNLVWCMLIGVPPVPADEDGSKEACVRAIDQRVAILKAVFVELNKEKPEAFLDKGLLIYDQAAGMAKDLLEEDKPAESFDLTL